MSGYFEKNIRKQESEDLRPCSGTSVGSYHIACFGYLPHSRQEFSTAECVLKLKPSKI